MITFDTGFRKVEIYIALNSEMRIDTQFKNILTIYNKSDILTKSLVLLPVDWHKNGLLITKRIHIVKKIIGYS